MSNKKTAVDYLLREISEILGEVSTHGLQNLLLVDAYKKAKAMEKEQIIKFVLHLHKVDMSKTGTDILIDEAEQYYKETYEQ